MPGYGAETLASCVNLYILLQKYIYGQKKGWGKVT